MSRSWTAKMSILRGASVALSIFGALTAAGSVQVIAANPTNSASNSASNFGSSVNTSAHEKIAPKGNAKAVADATKNKGLDQLPKMFKKATVPADMMAAIDEYIKRECKALGGDEYQAQREIGRAPMSSCMGDCYVVLYLLEGVPYRGSNNNTQYLAAFTYNDGKPLMLACCQSGGRGLRYLKLKSIGPDDLKFDSEFYKPKDPMSTPSGRGFVTYIMADRHLIEMP